MCFIPSPCCYYPPMPPMGFGYGFGCGFPMHPMSFGCVPYMPMHGCNFMAANFGWNAGSALGAGIGLLINKYC